MSATAEAPAQPMPQRKDYQRTTKEKWRRRAPLMPALIFTIIVTQIPFLMTIALSMLNWNALQPGDKNFLGMGNYTSFAGFENYATVFTDSRLRDAVVNTVVLTTSVVVISVVIGLAIAVLLDKKFPGRGICRTLLIAPFLVMPVATALLWKHALYNPEFGLFNGILNWIWQLFGAEQGPVIEWISSAPMAAVVATLVWQWTPFMMLIILAGLQAQSSDVLEAARLDRATAMQTFRFITLPHLRRYIELSAVLGSIFVLQTFDAIYTITQGGPGSATTNLPYEIYLTLFRKYEYGEAAAAGVVTVVASLIIATFALRVVSSLFTEEHAK